MSDAHITDVPAIDVHAPAGVPQICIGIVRDDSRTAVRNYVREESVGWLVAFDPGSQAALNFATRGQPETFAISPDGVIVGANIGPSSVADLEQMLAAARGVR